MASNRLNKEYIHYHYVNYLRFGTKYPKGKKQNTTKIYDFHKKKNEFIKHIKATRNQVILDRKTISQFEIYYKSILNPDLQNNSNDFIKANQILQEAVNKKLGREFNHITSSGKAILSADESKELQIKRGLELKAKVLNDLKLDNSKIGVTAKKLENSLKQVYNLAQQYLNAIDPNNLNAIQIKQQVQLINNLIQTTILESKTAISGMDLDVQKIFSQYIQTLNRTSQGYIDKNEDIISIINNLIQLLKAPNVAFITGVGGEYTAAVTQIAIQQGINNVSTEALDKMIQKTLTGAVSEPMGNLAKAQNLNALFGFKDSSGVEMNIHESENNMKIDIKIPDAKKQQDIGISIKNYNLSRSRDLNLVEDSPFTSMLMEDPIFASHYLNIASVHEEELSTKNIQKNNSISGYKNYSTVIKEANQGLKMILLLAGLRGAAGRAQATYILVNDNSKSNLNSVKLINIYDLMDKVLQDESEEYLSKAVKITLDHQKLTDNTTKELFSNNWTGPDSPNKGAAIDRMSNILMEAHKKKVSVALKPSVIKSFFK